MIGKHVVIDTLDNFKAKLDLIPSSAIVLIKDVGQIYAHGTYFGAQKTYSLLTKTADGLAPHGGTSASSLISDVDTEWVLTVTNGENPTWRKLPANAFNSSSYTLSSATTSDLGGIKVGQVYTATFDDLVGQYYKINVDKNGLAYVHVPWINNPYTASGSGITLKDNVFSLSLNSVTKLDSAIGNKIYAVSLDKNGKLCVSVPWVDTNNIFVGATETKNGSSGMVPAPIANQHRYFLRGDGTWVKPNLSDLNDDVVNGKYLPLSGGTLTASTTAATLWIQSGQTNDSAIGFKRKGQSDWAYITYRGDENWCVSNEGWTKNLTLYHSGNFNPSDYLPLTGGRIDGASYLPLQINSTDASVVRSSLYITHNGGGKAQIGWDGHSGWGTFLFNYSSNGVLGITDSGTPYFGIQGDTLNTLIHSGNIGSQSVNYANSAGMLSACSLSDANTATYTDTSLRWFSTIPSNVSNLPTVTGWQNGLLAFPLHSNGVTAQLYFSATKKIYYRSIAGSDYDWNEIAYVTDNVASATKLQTARTIWGQSFDGTGNVSGNLHLTNDVVSDSNSAAGKLFFSGNQSGNHGVYLTAIHVDTYGRKRFGIVTTNAASDTPTWVESFSVLPSGNVGIRTTDPKYELDVNGSIRANGNVLLEAANSTTGGGIAFWNASGWVNGTINAKNLILNYAGGNVGIGTLNPSCKLEVNGPLKISDYIDIRESGGKNRFTAYVYSGIGRLYSYNDDTGYNDLYVGQNSTNAIVVKANGNVGIGTGSPTYKLDVNGDIATSLYLRIKAWSGYGSGSCDMWFDGNKTKLIMASGAVFGYNVDIEGTLHMTNDHKIFWHDDSANYYISSPNTATSAMLEYKAYGGHRFYGGNVGIGVESPEYKLHVSGSIYGSYGKFGGILINKGYGNNTGTDTIETATSGNMLYINYYHKGGLNLCLGGGNVGIGTTSPAQKLHVNGHIWSDGDIGAQSKIIAYGNIIAKGNIGVGTESPVHKLDVNGSIYGDHYYGNQITLYTRGNGTYTRAWITAKDSAGDFIIEAPLTTESASGTRAPITLTWRGGYPAMGGLKITGYSEAELGKNKIWHAGNDGSGSGLDADLLDGYHISVGAAGTNSSTIYFVT